MAEKTGSVGRTNVSDSHRPWPFLGKFGRCVSTKNVVVFRVYANLGKGNNAYDLSYTPVTLVFRGLGIARSIKY